MSLVQCPECSSQVSSKALVCRSCGFPISKSRALSVDERGQSPLMIAYQSPIARESVVLSQANTRPTITKFIDDEEFSERREYQNGIACLQCGGNITPDDINCTHCKTLIMRRYCSYCSKLIPDHATVCPLCNKNVKEHFLYARLRRAKILIGVGAAAMLILGILIVIWQQSQSETTPLQAHAISKPENPSPETKSKAPKMQQEEIKLPAPPEVQEIVPPSVTTKPKLEPTPEVQEPIKTLEVEEQAESKVEPLQPKTTELAKVEEPRPEVVLSAAAQRALELKSHQRITKGRILNAKGFNLIKEGRPSDAIPLLVQSVRSFPQGTRDVTYAYALFNLAVAYRMAGRPDIAIPILEERIKINNQRDVVERELNTAKHQARLSGLSQSKFN